MRTGEKLKG